MEADAGQRKEWLKGGRVPCDYPDSVAADYSDCLKIVEEKVRPERLLLKDGGPSARGYARRWWNFGRMALGLYASINDLRQVIVKAQVSNTWAWEFTDSSKVLDAKLIVFCFDDAAILGLLQSSIHLHWALKYRTTMRTDLSYAPTQAFETFPFP